MRLLRKGIYKKRNSILLLLATALAIACLHMNVSAQAGDFEVRKIANGVYVAMRTEPPGLTVIGNSVFIINDKDVVVVDTTLTPGTASELLVALKKLTNKPVKYVINTHWHDDHIMGNEVFRKAFPDAQFIAHLATRDYLPGTGLANRKMALSEQGYPGFIRSLRNRLARNESVFGGPMNEEERSTYESSAKIAERYMAENPGVEVVLPTITLEDRLVLKRGRRTIEILFLGRGHTSGDVVVHLPKERVVVAGDLVVWPVPYIGSPQSHPGDWSVTLGKLIALNPRAIVPGHGPVLNDHTYVKQMVRLLASVKQQVEAAVLRGETLEQTRKRVNLDEFEKLFSGESRIRKLIFRNYVTGPAVGAAYLDAKAK
ncbi:MAG TPA: MBL fold metallo-hydrolase [Pyrinomonadaceae bacterium]|nr:MBL fold metallo-hydrolase [Pyrinomonadaceae bacterium]